MSCTRLAMHLKNLCGRLSFENVSLWMLLAVNPRSTWIKPAITWILQNFSGPCQRTSCWEIWSPTTNGNDKVRTFYKFA